MAENWLILFFSFEHEWLLGERHQFLLKGLMDRLDQANAHIHFEFPAVNYEHCRSRDWKYIWIINKVTLTGLCTHEISAFFSVVFLPSSLQALKSAMMDTTHSILAVICLLFLPKVRILVFLVLKGMFFFLVLKYVFFIHLHILRWSAGKCWRRLIENGSSIKKTVSKSLKLNHCHKVWRDSIYKKWSSIYFNWECLVSPPLAGLYCNRTFDRYACWPDTPAGLMVNISCPLYLPWYDKGKKQTEI